MALALGAIVGRLGGELRGDPGFEVQRLAPVESAGPGELSFIAQPRLHAAIGSTRAGCLIVGPELADAAAARGQAIVCDSPYLYFARLTRLWREQQGDLPQPGIHRSAVVDPGAEVDPTASIGPLCVVERGARIGAGTVLVARVHIGTRCVIGARCLLHPGVVIGADGFGFAPDGGRWHKIEQLGAVTIGDDVEIGANTCIDRGALEDTVIGDGVKIDNLVQIGHNVRIGEHTAIAGCTGIAGSARIGRHCMLGGSAHILGHLEIADHVQISAVATVTRSIMRPGLYSGHFPIDDNAGWEKNAASLRQLHKLRARLIALEKKLNR